MTYILAAQRTSSPQVTESFERYRAYLEANRTNFPASAFELASSDWYFDANDHRCPHDARLLETRLVDVAEANQWGQADTAITLTLLGAYADFRLQFTYPKVFAYSLEGHSVRRGHGDWRYDEFRLGSDHQVIHEIEWRTGLNTARWTIVASDVVLTLVPCASGT